MLLSIQFLRFVAAFVVVVYHAGMQLIIIGGSFPLWLSDLMWMGAAGVPVFFAISGLVMCHASSREFARPGASWSFIVRRALRIYPAYWVAAFCYLTLPPAYLLGWWSAPLEQVGALLLLPGHGSGIITPAWTLVYELYFYAVFAVLLVLPAPRAVLALSLFFTASVAAGAVLHPTNAFLEVATNIQLMVFLAGVLIARFVLEARDGRYLVRLHPAWLLILSALGFALSAMAMRRGVPATLALGLPSILVVAAAALAERQGRVPRFVRDWSWLGDSSYALYLAHMLVILHGAPWLGPHGADIAGGLWRLAALILASLLAGFALHYWVERPMMGWLRGRLRRA